ncbi:ankyrin repeat domain-containing protein [Nonomuraea sp. SBT364]|uniref:ankyrin repeat domain-containing protein n=1 Tax=Nonomuraea sp. SBT364 TaxID=1580530 RepID=UPI000AA25000|nr:ankyrin repeat domain-containing protein [Nonomuraea sp. SBT364]
MVDAREVIRSGDVAALRALLAADPALATARPDGARTLLHVATDWPGHFPAVAETITTLVGAGADVHARFVGEHAETPLHWAASCGDVAALDALLDAGARIDAPGAVIADGTPLDDAVAFGQWEAARRLVARGAAVGFRHAAALGLPDRVTVSGQEELDLAFWYACHGGQRRVAERLLERGATLDWTPPWEPLTPLDAALRQGFAELAGWLRERGAISRRS